MYLNCVPDHTNQDKIQGLYFEDTQNSPLLMWIGDTVVYSLKDK